MRNAKKKNTKKNKKCKGKGGKKKKVDLKQQGSVDVATVEEEVEPIAKKKKSPHKRLPRSQLMRKKILRLQKKGIQGISILPEPTIEQRLKRRMLEKMRKNKKRKGERLVRRQAKLGMR